MHNLWDDEEVQWAKIRCMKISFCLLLLFLFLLCIREIHLRKKMILYKTTPFLQIHIMYLGHKHIYEYIHHQTFTSLSINLNQKIHFTISFLKYIFFGNIMGILIIKMEQTRYYGTGKWRLSNNPVVKMPTQSVTWPYK